MTLTGYRPDPPRRTGPQRKQPSGGRSGTTRERVPLSTRLKALRKGLDLNQPAMARVLGVSQRKLSQLENAERAPRPDTSRRLVEVERLHNALGEIMEEEELPGWLEQANPAFDGASPLQLIERGEIDRLWQMVYMVRSGHPI